jgi:membrane protein required for colicin V production
VVLAVLAAGKAYAFTSSWLGNYVTNPALSKVLCVALIGGTMFLIVVLAAMMLKGMLTLMLLGWVDRVGGAAVGLAAGGVLMGVLLVMALKAPFFDVSAATAESSVAGAILERFPSVLSFVGEQVSSIWGHLH